MSKITPEIMHLVHQIQDLAAAIGEGQYHHCRVTLDTTLWDLTVTVRSRRTGRVVNEGTDFLDHPLAKDMLRATLQELKEYLPAVKAEVES